MPNLSDVDIRHLSEGLQIDIHFFKACLEEAVIEVEETEGHFVVSNGTLLRLRRLQRLCLTFNVDVPVALMLVSRQG